MITDEQIMQIAKNYIRHVGSHYINELAIPDNGTIEGFARELIALAQEVKGLEFVQVDRSTFYASAFPFGGYSVKNCGNDIWYVQITFRHFFIDVCIDKAMTQAEAIAAANEDYQRRVLACLVNGGV